MMWQKRDDWFWEGNVQAVLAEHLRGLGYQVIEVDTGSKASGPDIQAQRGTERLLIEAKGWPSDKYVDGDRAGQKKRTNPSTQAKHWFGEALLTIIRRREAHPQWQLAIALPDYPTYRVILEDTRWALTVLGISVFMISSDRNIILWK